MSSKNSYFLGASTKQHVGCVQTNSVFICYSIAQHSLAMYEIYTVIGVILVITGFISSLHFALQLKRSKYRKLCINHFLDGIGALFLGFFYIYSYLEIKETLYYPTLLTFQEETYLNVSEEPILNIFPTSTTSVNSELSTHDAYGSSVTDNYVNVPTTSENLEIKPTTNMNENETSNSNEEITMIPLIDTLKNGSFSFYENFFKNIVRQKTSNNSKFVNRTIFYNNKEYGKYIKNLSRIRKKRELSKYVDPYYNCFKRNFMKHALLICSFLYSVICLINKTTLCYKHKNPKNTTVSRKAVTEESISSISTGDQKNTIFDKKNDDTRMENMVELPIEKGSPNLDIFLAKSSKISHEISKKELKQESLTSCLSKQVPYILKHLIIWFSPGLFVYSTYIIMNGHNSYNSSFHVGFAINFTPTEFNRELLKTKNNVAFHLPQEKSKEINNIVQNIYNIIKQTSTLHETENNINKGVMYDIVHHLNQKHYEKINMNGCTFNTTPFKIQSFLIFFLIYIGSIFCSKMLQIQMNHENNTFRKSYTIYLLLYFTLWLPFILELFYRIYILNENQPDVYSFTLALANFFVIYSNISNYLYEKNIRKIFEVVKL